MTQDEIWQTAMAQSAVDLNCRPEDFLSTENVIVRSGVRDGYRSYLHLPFFCNLVTYGNNIVASVSAEAESAVRSYLEKREFYTCFETPAILLLEEAFRPLGHRLCFMAEYFLPELSSLRECACNYELRVLGPADFAGLYVPQWEHALSPNRPESDVLGVGAYDGGRLVGLAACSADCATMWQIGVDVLSEYRRQGIASAMTARLTQEILARGKVPFYCAAWSNLKSVRNALKVGFRPAWMELTALPKATVLKLLRNE